MAKISKVLKNANNKTMQKGPKVNWDSPKERILLYADIMGFKSLVSSKQHSDLVKQLKYFIQKLTSLMEPLETGEHIRMTMFSDTIIIGADSATIRNFNIIVKATALIMHLCHNYNYAINGCISCGNLTYEMQTRKKNSKNKNKPSMPLFVGRSVVDAHLLNEELFCYGFVLHPSAEKLFKKSLQHSDTKYHHPFYFLPTAMKSGGYAQLYYLSWCDVSTSINHNSKEVSNDDILVWLKTMESSVQARPRTYIYNTSQIIKYIMTEKASIEDEEAKSTN